jgi:hypothetical protein
MNDLNTLKRALAQASKKAKADCRYQGKEDMLKLNDRAVILFSSEVPLYSDRKRKDPTTNITRRSLRRVNRLMRREGQNLIKMDFQSILDWIYENWDRILKLLLTLLPLFLI